MLAGRFALTTRERYSRSNEDGIGRGGRLLTFGRPANRSSTAMRVATSSRSRDGSVAHRREGDRRDPQLAGDGRLAAGDRARAAGRADHLRAGALRPVARPARGGDGGSRSRCVSRAGTRATPRAGRRGRSRLVRPAVPHPGGRTTPAPRARPRGLPRDLRLHLPQQHTGGQRAAAADRLAHPPGVRGRASRPPPRRAPRPSRSRPGSRTPTTPGRIRRSTSPRRRRRRLASPCPAGGSAAGRAITPTSSSREPTCWPTPTSAASRSNRWIACSSTCQDRRLREHALPAGNRTGTRTPAWSATPTVRGSPASRSCSGSRAGSWTTATRRSTPSSTRRSSRGSSARVNHGVSAFSYRGFYGTSGLTTGDVFALTNGRKMPFAVTITCGTGGFAGGTCISEAWMRAGIPPARPPAASPRSPPPATRTPATTTA